MDVGLTAEEILAMVDIIAKSAVILVRTEIDGDILTRNWMEQTNYYLNMIAYIIQKIWFILYEQFKPEKNLKLRTK